MNYISPKEWIENYSKNPEYQLIDIREDYEFETCPIRPTHIPMEEIALHPEKLNDFKNCVFMCNSGKRAAALSNLLEVEHHLTSMYVLEGGFTELEKYI